MFARFKYKKCNKHTCGYGFTLIEMLIAVSIIGVLIVPLVTTYRDSRNNQALNASAEALADHIRNAHVFAREANQKSNWGIINDTYVKYNVVSGNADSYTKESAFSLDPGITFDHNFTIWFEKGTGETINAASITLVNSKKKKITLEIFKTGVVEVSNIESLE
ncbi:prepilin-type N-terminal cleavage/methylation domain-containing protein [Candidatus Woesebacteria bacterium]|nr:MAG: prepilin-type N-terminal cleavage/methylation domain-containing protein [Candidatus Woesebacteria bacterium]